MKSSYKFISACYPCKNKGMFLKAFTFFTIFALTLSICVYALRNGDPQGAVLVFASFLFIILVINAVEICYDWGLVEQILQVLQRSGNEHDVEHICKHLEYTKGRRIHCLLRRRPEILLLTGKIFENYAENKNDMNKIEFAGNLIKISVQQDRTLAQIAETENLSEVARKISEKTTFISISRFIAFVRLFFKSLLWLFIVFLSMAIVIGVIRILQII